MFLYLIFLERFLRTFKGGLGLAVSESGFKAGKSDLGLDRQCFPAFSECRSKEILIQDLLKLLTIT